jgi:hypothetical protein
MKRSAILLLLVCAPALPAAAFAQGAAKAEAPYQPEVLGQAEVPGQTAGSAQSEDILTTKWSLKQPRKKAVAQTAGVAGPAVPAPPVVRYPKPKQRTTRQRLPNNRTNVAKTITQVIRK